MKDLIFTPTDKLLPGPTPLGLLLLDYVNLETGDVFTCVACTSAENPWGWYPHTFFPLSMANLCKALHKS